jgi:protein phosphatase
MSSPLTLRYAVRTDPGLVRETNQDSVYAGPRLLAVADGMGGMAAGDLASSVVITRLSELDQDVPNAAMIDVLDRTVAAANEELREGVDANPELRGMGTTLTALLISGRAIAMVHIGDSRAYLLRDGRLRQVTKDHTYVQMLVDEGAITAEEASHHPHRSLVTQVLQGEPIEPNYSVREAIKGDRYLLCSDGLSNVVSMATMGDVLRDYRDSDACAERLIDLALRAGGPDNITAIVADIVAVDDSDPQAAVAHRANAPAEERPSPRPRPARAAPGGVDRPAQAAAPVPAAEARASRWAAVRLTLILVVTLGVLIAAASVWYASTG